MVNNQPPASQSTSNATPQASTLDKDVLAIRIYNALLPSYPQTAPEHYFQDTKYILSLLMKHLRCTYLTPRSILRNSNFFITYLSTIKYKSRCQWLMGMEDALDFFYPCCGVTQGP